MSAVCQREVKLRADESFIYLAGIANSVLVFATFLVTIPGIITPARAWLKLGGVMATVSAMFSMIIGLYLWITTLQTKGDFAPLWMAQPAAIQDLMETTVSIFMSGYG